MIGRRMVGALAALMLVTAACGSDDDGAGSGDIAADTPATTAGSDVEGTTAPDPATTDGTDAPAEGVVVRVGVPLDQSGPAAISNIGLSELEGMKLALDEVTASGMLGANSIEIVSIDTKADKQEAVAGVLKLIEQDDVDAIVGFTLTPSFLAAAPQAVEANLPVIAAGLAGPGVTEIGDTVFRIIPAVAGLYVTSDALVTETLGATSAAYLYTSDSETTVGIHGVRKAALEESGVETKIEQTTVSTDTDYRAQLTEMDNAGADVIVLTAFPGQFAGIFLQAEELGIDTPIISSDGTGRNEVIDQAGGAMQCTIYNAVWAEQNETGRNPQFVEGVRTELGDEPDLYYAAGYDAMWMYATALANAGSADTDAIVGALNDITDFEGAFGVYEFDENRNPGITGTNLQIQDGEIVLWTPDTACER